MALHTKKQFAELCGLATNALSVYINREKVFVDNDLIDDTIEKNKRFLEKMAAKKKDAKPDPLPAKNIQAPPVVSDSKKSETPAPLQGELFATEEVKPIESQSYTESERQLKYLDTVKRKAEIEKINLDVAKRKGELIPSELVKPVFIQHNQSITTEFKNAVEEIVRVFAKRRSLTVNEVAEITGELIECINASLVKATGLTVKSVEGIVNEYAERKGVGERNL